VAFAAENNFCNVYWCTSSSFGRARVRFSVRPETSEVEKGEEEEQERLRFWDDGEEDVGDW
jgi:hypothetical protein